MNLLRSSTALRELAGCSTGCMDGHCIQGRNYHPAPATTVGATAFAELCSDGWRSAFGARTRENESSRSCIVSSDREVEVVSGPLPQLLTTRELADLLGFSAG